MIDLIGSPADAGLMLETVVGDSYTADGAAEGRAPPECRFEKRGAVWAADAASDLSPVIHQT